jgi:mRNA interferase MazF
MTQLLEELLLEQSSVKKLGCGDIITYDFGNEPDSTLVRLGNEQAGERPAIVVTSDTFNNKVGFAWISPITNTPRPGHPCISQIPLPNSLKTSGFILPDQLTAINCSSQRIIERKENVFNFTRDTVVPYLLGFLPKKWVPSLSIKNQQIPSSYLPDFSHIIEYSIFPNDNTRHSPPLAFVVTSKSFNKTTGRSWLCPVVLNSTGHVYEVSLPDSCNSKGVILLDQIQTLDCKRHFKPVYQISSDMSNTILARVTEIISSSITKPVDKS